MGILLHSSGINDLLLKKIEKGRVNNRNIDDYPKSSVAETYEVKGKKDFVSIPLKTAEGIIVLSPGK